MIQITEDKVRLSVREFVEFLGRAGDIDLRVASGLTDVKRMQLGSKIHRKLQKEAGGLYTPEVPLKLERKSSCELTGREIPYTLCIEGRADGIIEDDDGLMIDEIKTVERDVSDIKEPVAVHLAQAKVYAAIVAQEDDLEKIRVQMRYVQTQTLHIKRFETAYTKEELETWLHEQLDAFKRWGDFAIQERSLRQASIAGLPFPYPYRPGQRDLIVLVYRSIEAKKRLFIQAPTGTGKTLATLYPAVQAIGQGQAQRVLYLTAKTITRTVAEQAFELMRKNGLHFRTVTITAKEKLCPQEEVNCDPEHCPRAKGHFDRVNDCLFALLSRFKNIDRSALLQMAEEYKVCPYELAMDAADWADGIIGDYNYGFDPEASLTRFFAEGAGSSIMLVDEAHNLVDRARTMYSAKISKEAVLSARRALKKISGSKIVIDALFEVNNWLLLAGKRLEDEPNVLTKDEALDFSEWLLDLDGALLSFLTKHRQFSGRDEVLLFFFGVHHFCGVSSGFDHGYLWYLSKEGKDVIFHAFCVDPSSQLKKRMEVARSVILFSATLLPVRYFKEMLTGEVNDTAVYAKSIFPSRNKQVFVASDVSSLYKERSQDMYKRIAEYIVRTVRAKRGHYIAYFPSYAFLAAVREQIKEEHGTQILVQERDMDEEHREAFLHAFREQDHKSLLGLCVMGGAFAEGIDLKHDGLIGVLVVGTGLPQLSRENDLLRTFFDEQGKDGFAYAYTYPGMNNCLQAAGRVIRTEEDRGVIVLLDRRFLTARYRALYPREWDSVRTVRSADFDEDLHDFWETAEKEQADT